jgi:hypothetical protein
MFGLALPNLVVDWGSFYANHAAVRTTVVFAHIGGLVTAGGAAMTADRGLLSASRKDEAVRRAQLAATRNTHNVVLAGLAAVVLSGALLFASDVDTFLSSRVFWTKMALVALLLVNGAVLTSAERRAAHGVAHAWNTLRQTAALSLILWTLVTLAGVALVNS